MKNHYDLYIGDSSSEEEDVSAFDFQVQNISPEMRATYILTEVGHYLLRSVNKSYK